MSETICTECKRPVTGASPDVKIANGEGVWHHRCAIRVGVLRPMPPPRGLYRGTTSGAGMY